MSVCVFCLGEAVTWVRGAYHPTVRSHGPFDIERCSVCGSTVTVPPPSSERQQAFYAQYEDGQPPQLLRAREDSPQVTWYTKCVDHIAAIARPSGSFTWLETAAGSGTFTRLFAERFPSSRGTALDYHARPAELNGIANVDWIQGDLSRGAVDDLGTYDVVAALAILEHVPDVDAFVASLVRRVRPGGTLFMTCPDAASLMARALGTRWPYHLPGEHLHVPSAAGARALMTRVLDSQGRRAQPRVRPITIPYTVRYLAAYLGAAKPAKAVPKTWTVPVPAGALEIAVTLD
jgi:2-polyprenyl-3-methyl-5-hydroxy-6-metoxy-1,4-benzoquinol methylase